MEWAKNDFSEVLNISKFSKKKRIIAILISIAILTSILMPSIAAAVTCPIVNCGASVTTQFQGVGVYSTGTHTVNKFLGLFGGETCSWIEYHKYYANTCTKGHIVGAWNDYYLTTHNVAHK